MTIPTQSTKAWLTTLAGFAAREGAQIVVLMVPTLWILARAAERWGLNTVEVLNTNNRTTLGSVNNNKLNVGLGAQR